MTEADIAEARQRMIAMRFRGKATATGGKEIVRRKKKVSSRSSVAQSDMKLVSQLGVDNLSQLQNFAATQGAQVPGVAIEEEDDNVPDLVEGNFEEVSED